GKTIHWDYLFASTESNHSDRPVETLTPLAQALGKNQPNHEFSDADYKGLVKHLKKHAKDRYAKSNILICWHHGQLLKLATELGAAPAALPASSNWPTTWPGAVFGWLKKIYYTADGAVDTTTTQAVNEHLMPDDTQDPVYNA